MYSLSNEDLFLGSDKNDPIIIDIEIKKIVITQKMFYF